MKPEELDLVDTKELVDALHRRCSASVVLGARKGKTPEAMDESLITFGGSMLQVAGLLFQAELRLRMDTQSKLIADMMADQQRQLDEEQKGE